MKHIMRWVGQFKHNYKDLQPNPTRFVTKTGGFASISPFPTDFDGIRFYNMEDKTGEKFVSRVVMVENIKLPNPLSLDRARHTDGKGIGPAGCSFGDTSAKNLLLDIADRNPEHREAISQIYKKYFGAGFGEDKTVEKKGVTPQNSPYLPTYDDYENARRKCLRERKTRVSIEEILDTIEVIVKQSKKNLSPDWRGLTKTSISSWKRNERG